MFSDSIVINNHTSGSVQVIIAETTMTLSEPPSMAPNVGSLDVQSLINQLRPAFANANITEMSLKRRVEETSDDPLAYTTILTDGRGENSLGAADIFRVQYQYRTNILGNFHDFRIVLANLPDTNIIIGLSIDTDQDFGTGSFPTPLGIGPTARDIGSEFEVLLDASGVLIDSLTPLGRIPAGIVISTANDTLTIVGLPFLLSIQKDSVLTISTETLLGGINATWLNDPDRKMNIGVVATHIQANANPLPDFAPAESHGNIGGETGVSWLSEDRVSATITSGDSATIHLTGLAAQLPGIYNTILKVIPAGRPTVNLPVQLNVTALAQPHIVLNASSYSDTIRLGDSTVHVLSISNTGNADLVWGVLDTSNTTWASATPALGSTLAGQSSPATVTIRSAGLTPNTTYNSRFLILSNDQVTGTIAFPLSLRVNPAVGVSEREKAIPTSFALSQNYPNPFNPETNISFDLPKSTLVNLRLFNLIGQEVGTIVSGQLPAGTHTYRLGAERFGLTSGVYFYRLSAGEFVQTRKMVLLR
ncbi:MAG: Peptidase protein [Bacteroidetes bacterium]|nr:Peptidase protein [Bacteroidota bacterium]